VVDEEAVLEYVKSLAGKYNTAYKAKEFETSYGQTITISNGFYGWKINNDEEVAQILDDLAGGTSVTREPVYSQTANSHSDKDWGNSYVEINLTAQHLYMYKDGKLVIESDFVSGSVAGNHNTHTGAFAVTYKTLNAVLRGPDYETPVTYWMPFNGDEGMHDATWRSKFGGNIYKTNGSHGCINLPKSVAKTIYENIEKGYPVFVYNLAGTESKSTSQSDIATVINYINAIGVVTLESESIITTARTLYNALDSSVQGDVTNYDYLVAAEAQLAQLKAEQAAAQAALEQQAAAEAAAAAASGQ
jgi:lipoprotein-anchoring transpeptidase ErfK/SrfK/predicted nucleic-acid-binding protein